MHFDSDVRINTESGITLEGHLAFPDSTLGTVIFAHGSGSSRFSPRNQKVASTLNEAHLATLLFDLLTPEESLDREKVFNIPLLADRLFQVTRWVQNHPMLKQVPIGYFGASTGAGAALWAASYLGHSISAIVSRGGRPDLAIPRLADVTAPVLLIVGEDDSPVIEMNEEALRYLSNAELTLIPGATHLFEEPGTLEAVARHSIWWFNRHFKEISGGRAAA